MDQSSHQSHRLKMSADENITIALHREMNDVTGTKTAHTLCGCVEFPALMTHDENHIQMTAVLNITSSNSENNRMSEFLTSGRCRLFWTFTLITQCKSSAGAQSTILVLHQPFIWIHKIVFWRTVMPIQKICEPANWHLMPTSASWHHCSCGAQPQPLSMQSLAHVRNCPQELHHLPVLWLQHSTHLVGLPPPTAASKNSCVTFTASWWSFSNLRLVPQTTMFPISFLCPGQQPRFTTCFPSKSKEGGAACQHPLGAHLI